MGQTLCSNDWLALITWMLIVFSDWFFGALSTRSPAEKENLALYESLRTRNKQLYFLSSTAYKVIRGLIYILLVVGFFLFWYYDDACRHNPTLNNAGLEILAWILIILILLVNKGADALIFDSLRTNFVVSFILTGVETLLWLGLLVVMFYFAASYFHELYYSAIVFTVAFIWKAYTLYPRYVVMYISMKPRK